MEIRRFPDYGRLLFYLIFIHQSLNDVHEFLLVLFRFLQGHLKILHSLSQDIKLQVLTGLLIVVVFS